MIGRNTPEPLRLLLLEDNPDDATLVIHELESAGYVVQPQVVETREEFAAHLHTEVDVILSDHALSQFNALQALEMVREAELDIPFIIVSGVIDEVTAVEAMRRGAADYLLKDRLARLGAAVEQALHEKRLRAEKERAFEALRESEARWRGVVERHPDPILISRNGRVVYLNPAGHRFLGAESLASVRGVHLCRLVAPESRATLAAQLRTLANGQATEPVEYRVPGGSGEVRIVEAYSVPVIYEGEACVQSVIRDVTVRYEYEARLIETKQRAEEVARLKSSLLNNMSHEVRTPLTGILGYAEVLADHASPDVRQTAATIQREGERLLTTLDSIMELAQIESQALVLHPEEFDLVREIEQLLPPFERQARAAGLAFRFVCDEPRLPTRLDRRALARSLTHVLANAVKYTPQGSITVSLRRDGARACIEVADTGIGISADYQSRLFNPFHQESSGLNRAYEGLGLGLPLTKRLVERMGGTVDVQSTQGQGTTLVILLPLRIEADPAPAERPATQAPRAESRADGAGDDTLERLDAACARLATALEILVSTCRDDAVFGAATASMLEAMAGRIRRLAAASTALRARPSNHWGGELYRALTSASRDFSDEGERPGPGHGM